MLASNRQNARTRETMDGPYAEIGKEQELNASMDRNQLYWREKWQCVMMNMIETCKWNTEMKYRNDMNNQNESEVWKPT